MQPTLSTVPIARIYPNQIVIYRTPIECFNRTPKQQENEKNLTRGEYNGYMSPKTKGKVKKYLVTWMQAVSRIKKSPLYGTLDKKPYLTFVTLTLPAKQCHSDNEIKRKLLTPFIENLKRLHNVWNYFWRAEAQENGNIHFHLIIDSYVHCDNIQELWNSTTDKLGYIDAFQSKHGHRNPPSTEIRKLKNKHSPEAYLIKYCCKADGYRPIKGRIHGCSDELRKLTPYEAIIDSHTADFINNALEDSKSKIIEGDCYTVILCNTTKLLHHSNRPLAKHISSYYLESAVNLYRKITKPKAIDRPAVPPPKPPEYIQARMFAHLYPRNSYEQAFLRNR